MKHKVGVLRNKIQEIFRKTILGQSSNFQIFKKKGNNISMLTACNVDMAVDKMKTGYAHRQMLDIVNKCKL